MQSQGAVEYVNNSLMNNEVHTWNDYLEELMHFMYGREVFNRKFKVLFIL